jgi:hypothetical protein
MVQAPPSILDRIPIDQYDYSDQESDSSPICPNNEFADSTVTTLRPAEMVIVNVEGNVTDSNDSKRTQKTICKVPPYVPETTPNITSPPEKTSTVIKPTAVYSALSPIRRTLIPKRMPSMIPTFVTNRIASSVDVHETAPLDLSLK